ncbi:MAG: hypothetical protein J1E34_08995 [Oscillospiraceae bacterium]|nr:hypothetical protein [Oscillospiraceae bacterium]
MTILVDMDDTIEQLLKAWVKGVNDKYARCVSYNDITSWDVSAAFPGLTHKQVYEIPMQTGFWKTVEPIADAPEVLSHLIDAGHKIFIVTATPYQSVFEKMNEVLFKYFPFLSWEQVIIANRKQMIIGDVLIDDGVHNLEGGQYIKILMTAPHNIHYDAEANGMIRVQSWKEIEKVIESLQQ